MKHTLAPLALVLVALLITSGCDKNKDTHGTSTRTAETVTPPPQTAQPPVHYTAYGEPMKLPEGVDPLPVGKVLADPAKYEGEYVRLTGNVSKVCTSKGCWMEMADAGTQQPLFVKFTCPVEGRLIPVAAIGKPVIVEGTVVVKEISEDDARHLKEESGATAAEVAKIVGPQRQITLESPAARVAGL